MTRVSSLFGLFSALAVAATGVFGCNAILGNKGGSLVADEPDGTISQDAGSDGYFVTDAPVDTWLPDTATPFDAAVGCPAGQKNCSGACISIVNPNFGCGGASCNQCDNEHATKVDCVGVDGGIACEPTCAAGFMNCKALGDGCQTDISKSDNCGGCGIKCSQNPVTFCAKGNGGGYSCVSSCPSPQVQCVAGGDCIDTDTDPKNCGGCGKPACTAPANANPTCAGGVCGFECKALYHLCGGVCVPDSTVTACGGGCKDCTPPASLDVTPSCDLGKCTYTCLGGQADCNNDLPSAPSGDGCETNLKTNDNRCGSCTNDCVARAPSGGSGTCQNGSCVFACPNGTHPCGAACISDTSTSQCGNGCVDCSVNAPAHAVPSCAGGACAYACATGFMDCNNDIARGAVGDGCEININTDDANCGGCNQPCTAGTTACCKGSCIDIAQACQ